jgi:hypothetical protein
LSPNLNVKALSSFPLTRITELFSTFSSI